MLTSASIKSQQSSLHSLYMIDRYQLNPAYAGFDRSLSVNFNYRTQWTGLNRNPATFYGNAHLPIYLLDGAAGIQFQTDRTGVLNYTLLSASFNRVFVVPGATLSAGLRLGFQQVTADGRLIITPEGVYNQNEFNHNDPVLSENLNSTFQPYWTAGFYMKAKDLQAGLAVSNWAPQTFNISEAQIENKRQLSLYTSYQIAFNELYFVPSMLVRTNLEQWQTDISGLVKSGNVFGGLSLRGFNDKSLESLVVLGGIKLNANYTLWYSYDVGLNDLRLASQGSHELHINYNLNKLIGIGLPPEIIHNPRNF